MNNEPRQTRREEIEKAIGKLEEFNKDPTYSNRLYAIEENLIFLKAIRSFPTYLKWLLTRAGKLDGTKLLELTDFPVPEWDRKMHWRLIEIQKRDKPGLVKPLVEAIIEFVGQSNHDLVCANLGAGGMEVDRQVIRRLLDSGFKKQLVVVAIDKSATTQEIAKENLAGIKDEVELVEVAQLDKDKLETIKQQAKKNIIVVLCQNDIFGLNRIFPNKYFDLVYHSLFKHHLTDQQKKEFDGVIKYISKNSFEFDGYWSKPLLLVQSIFAWQHPIFLNGTVFSMLRYNKTVSGSERMKISNKTAHYLKQL